MADDTSNLQPLTREVLTRSLRNKSVIKQPYDQPYYSPSQTAGTQMTLSIPAIVFAWVSRQSFQNSTVTVTMTPANADNQLYISQGFPHCAISNVLVNSANGTNLCNVQNYNRLWRAYTLLDGVDNNAVRLNTTGINYNTPYLNTGRNTMFEMTSGAIGNTTANQLIQLSTDTNFSLLPIFNSDAILPLNYMAAGSTVALKATFQVMPFNQWLYTTGTGASLNNISNVTISCTYFLTYLQPADELYQLMEKLIYSDNYMIPVSAFFSTASSTINGQLQLQQTMQISEENVKEIVITMQDNSLALAQNLDINNLFSNGSLQSVNWQAGGQTFPKTAPISRSLKTAVVNKRDAVDFFRFLYAIIQNSGSTKGVMINPDLYNALSSVASYDFLVGYSFSNGLQGVWDGYDSYANGTQITANMIFGPAGAFAAGGAGGQIISFAKYTRVYSLSIQGLINLPKAVQLAKINSMSEGAQILLNQLTNISVAA